MKTPFRPIIPEKVVTGLTRYATAHSISLTSAVAMLLTEALKQKKFITDQELKK